MQTPALAMDSRVRPVKQMLKFHGVDPASIGAFGKRWIPGSSPGMTTRGDAANYFLLKIQEAALLRQPLCAQSAIWLFLY